MPKMTVVMERKPMRVYEVNANVINIGRTEDMQIMIDNVSVSRHQAQIRLEDNGIWTVRDLGSANGTFLNGQRVTTAQPLTRGDEVSFGKFALFFDTEMTEAVNEAAVPSNDLADERTSTFYMKAEDVEQLQRTVARKRQAQLQWEAGGTQGTFYLPAGSVLVGRSAQCDLRVPAGPKHHVLVLRNEVGFSWSSRTPAFEVRNLSWWRRMRVNGEVVAHAVLSSGDTIEIGGLRLKFADALAPGAAPRPRPAEPAALRSA